MNSAKQNTELQNDPGFKPRVILVDDDACVLRLHQIMMEKFLATPFVNCVDNALDAMLLLEREVPDLLIVDLNMPGIDGFGFLKLLESDARYARVARVVLSGLDAREVSLQGELPPDVMLIEKPLDFKKMVQIQMHLIDQQKYRGKLQPEQLPPSVAATKGLLQNGYVALTGKPPAGLC